MILHEIKNHFSIGILFYVLHSHSTMPLLNTKEIENQRKTSMESKSIPMQAI